ncbi:amino acid ABC transporter substrate-binding protein [Hydrogenophaga sp. Root209]|uniref:ABC transporter substrate-binding protein n=1 Tax=unclassified Hydrogenophaga TaxID=2610897 RepID=UPI0006F5EA15|nr:ABC transporter substrate-binding protein [Hydrogenophaga sp. Root209]KRC09968.1 amino acid ABC transporter substrate-binding protein [Hydrogenophaga sp. Root209]
MKNNRPFLSVRLTTLGLAALVTFTAPASAQLRIGNPTGITGSVAAGVKENIDGARLYFDAVNARGGVNGQKIELVSIDDKFDPKVTVEVSRKLITEQKVLALFLNRGTPHSQALLPLLAEYKVPLVGPSTGAMVLHEPVNPWVFNVRATYQREAAKAIEHLASIGITRIALLATDDTFGADGAEGALKGFTDTKLNPVLQEKFPRDKPDFTEQAKRVNASNAQAVVVIGSAGNTANAVKAIRAAGSRAQAVTLSNNASDGFIKLLGEHARGVIVTQVFPNERSVAYPLIKEAQDLAKAKGLEGVSPAMMEGFAAAKVVAEGLKRAGPNPTPVALRDALEGMRNYDIGGLQINYSATDHTGLDFSDLSIVNASGKFMR